jgi:pimeloyl-ACP methyl ester carboxylesterase
VLECAECALVSRGSGVPACGFEQHALLMRVPSHMVSAWVSGMGAAWLVALDIPLWGVDVRDAWAGWGIRCRRRGGLITWCRPGVAGQALAYRQAPGGGASTVGTVEWPPTQLVDVGDRAICARVMGQGPTVVLEAGGAGEGLGETFSGTVEETLAAFATVLTYDRVGSGRTGGSPRDTVAQMADDLDRLLSATGCQTPAVIVGWSAGGMVAEMFAVRHPDKVAGLVLLDPTASLPERLLDDTPLARVRVAAELAFNDVWLRLIGIFTLLHLVRTRAGRAIVRRTATTGLGHDTLERIYRYTDSHPRAILETARIVDLLLPYFRETRAALTAAPLPDVPMRVISPQPRPRWQRSAGAVHDAALHDLVARFPNGRFVPAHGATHQWLPFERPDVVIEAVREVLALAG